MIRPSIEEAESRRETNAEATGIELPCRILLVEDAPDSQRLISFMLSKAGAEVECAANGKIGVDLALSARNAGKSFDVILMDMQMPVMDGYAATRYLRKNAYTLPIIAVTAHTMAGDRQKCNEAGCDEFVAKPIDRGRLLAVIRSCLDKIDARSTGSAVASCSRSNSVEGIMVERR